MACFIHASGTVCFLDLDGAVGFPAAVLLLHLYILSLDYVRFGRCPHVCLLAFRRHGLVSFALTDVVCRPLPGAAAMYEDLKYCASLFLCS